MIVGDKSLQIVDATPFVTPTPALVDGEAPSYGAAAAAPNLTQ